MPTAITAIENSKSLTYPLSIEESPNSTREKHRCRRRLGAQRGLRFNLTSQPYWRGNCGRGCTSREQLRARRREAVVRQLLTPAPDGAAVTWNIERVIANDVAFLDAHPMGQSKRRTSS